MVAIDARGAPTELDPEEVKEKQRQFAAVQATVREIRFAGKNKDRRTPYVRSNLGEYPFPEDGSTPYVLFHVTPQEGNSYFQLQGSARPDDYGTDGELLASIKENFRINMNDPFFAVRQGRLGFHLDIRELQGQAISLGSESAIEAVMEVMNPTAPVIPAAPKSPVAV